MHDRSQHATKLGERGPRRVDGDDLVALMEGWDDE